MEKIETVKVLPESEEQGNYIVINAEDFDKKKHKLYEGPDNPEPVNVQAPKSFEEMAAEMAAMKAELAALKGEAPAEGGDGWGAPPKE